MTIISVIMPKAMEHMQKFPIAVKTYKTRKGENYGEALAKIAKKK